MKTRLLGARGGRRRGKLLLSILLLMGGLLGAAWLYRVRFRRPYFLLGSCRNHATFLGMALDEYVSNHRSLPHVPGLPGEELVCRLDFHLPDQSVGLNCRMGAPTQVFGGWQMVNASATSWDDILMRLKGKRIPVIWCGKPHSVPGRNSDSLRRVLITIKQRARPYSSIGDFVRRETDEQGYMLYFWAGNTYRGEERELVANLAVINDVLRSNGEPETPLNVEGREDYARIARPFQTPWEDTP